MQDRRADLAARVEIQVVPPRAQSIGVATTTIDPSRDNRCPGSRGNRVDLKSGDRVVVTGDQGEGQRRAGLVDRQIPSLLVDIDLAGDTNITVKVLNESEVRPGRR